jgi:riboflavin transporter FmnP
MKKKRFTTREITTIAVMAALSVVMVTFAKFPFPPAPFLEYDAADIPIFIVAFAFGPAAGLILTIVVSVIQGLTVSVATMPWGVLMHIIATGSFVLAAGNLYKRNKTRKRAGIALLAGVAVWTGAMMVCNLLITPVYMNVPLEQVAGMLVPVLLPFNLMKAGINAGVTFLLYKPLSRLIHSKRGNAPADVAEKPE